MKKLRIVASPENCVSRMSDHFWQNWSSFDLGPRIMSLWLNYLKNGGSMPQTFYTLGKLIYQLWVILFLEVMSGLERAFITFNLSDQ
jgi:hypothetical protein